MARIVPVDFAKSCFVLSEGLCYVLEVFCFVDAIHPESFVLVSCEESNVTWGHAVMMQDRSLCHGWHQGMLCNFFYVADFPVQFVASICAGGVRIFWYVADLAVHFVASISAYQYGTFFGNRIGWCTEFLLCCQLYIRIWHFFGAKEQGGLCLFIFMACNCWLLYANREIVPKFAIGVFCHG